MAVTTRTVTTYTCDRCGRSSEDAFGIGGQYANLTIEAAGRGWDGGTGGATHKHWLCGGCLNDLYDFLQWRERTGLSAARNAADVRGRAHLHTGRVAWGSPVIGACGRTVRNAELIEWDRTDPSDRCAECSKLAAERGAK